MEPNLNLIGAAPAEGATALAAAMRRIEGPTLTLHRAGDVALFAEAPEPGRRRLLLRRDRTGLLRGLHRLQRRLEMGCLAGPFLAFDPGAASCPAGDLPRLLEGGAASLMAALQRDGRRHQWDVILRWSPEVVLTPRRAALAEAGGRLALAEAVATALREERDARSAALRAALRPAVIAVAEAVPVAGDTETGATVLVPAGQETLIEAALGTLPAAFGAEAAADLRGPLPPLSFAPLRVTALEAAAVEDAWRMLDLPERFDREELTRRWRAMARTLHPDHAGPEADPARLDAAGRAYRLLRGLAGAEPQGPIDRVALRARAGRHLSIPAVEAF